MEENSAKKIENFAEIIQRHAQSTPDSIAGRQGDVAITWSQYVNDINKIANKLRSIGCVKGDKIALLGKNTIPYSKAMLAITCVGGIFVPLPAMATVEVLKLMMGDSKPVALMIDQQCRTPGEEVAGLVDELLYDDGVVALDYTSDTIPLLDDWAADASNEYVPVDVEYDDIYNITYSSGTTGVPKGIMLNHGTRMMQSATMSRMGFDAAAVNYVSTPLYSLNGLSTWMAIVYSGGCNIYVPKFDARGFLEDTKNHKVSHVIMVPVQYDRILRVADYDSYDLSSLKLKLTGSAPCTVALKQEIAKRMPGEMVEMYSLTEGGITTALMINHFPDKLSSVGQPSSGCVVHIIDDDGNILPQGEIGEIVGRSKLKMSGYLNKKSESDAMIWRDKDGLEYTRSGDIGRLDEEGFLYLLDRKKDMIISGGMNIYAADIEAVLVEHDAIHEIAVVGMPSDTWGETPQAFVVLEEGVQLDLAGLVSFGAKKLGKAQRITGLWIMKEMPLNGLGKILKTELRSSGRDLAISGEDADA